MSGLPALADHPPASSADLVAHVRRRLAELPLFGLARQAVILCALLVAWISLKPFPSLSDLDLGDLVTGQEALTYATFGLLAASSLGLVLAEHRRALAGLASPALLALAGWLCLCTILSQDPATSAKRLALTAAVAAVTACLPLLARSRAELRNLLALAALALLAICYLGLVLAPGLSIHQKTDFLEPALAGDWRGSFGHKNAAAAVLAMVLFIGLAAIRSGWRAAGAAIVVLAGIFLVGCEGKSAAALSLAVIGLTSLFGVVRSFAARALLTLGPVLLLNLFSIGTVMSDALAAIVAQLPIDPTFTGRTDIWRFAVEAIAARPLLGHGFSAFWGSQTVRDVSDDGASWAGYAAHSHNGYLDTTLTLGLVGLVLTLAVFLVGPLRDYQRARAEGTAAAPLATLFLRIWLFGILLSSMESFFYDRADPIWFTFLIAIFGLRYLARFGTR